MLLVALVGAAAVHLAVILLLPRLSPESAWSFLRRQTPAFTFVAAESPDNPASPSMPGGNPLFRSATCHFPLESPVLLRSDGTVPFWTLSVYNDRGAAVFGVNDRIASDGSLDVVMATPAQVVELRKAVPDALSRAIIAQIVDAEGFAVLRVFVPDPSWLPAASDFIARAECVALAE